MENATKTVLLCGVGGQGTILAADLLAFSCMKANLQVKVSEIHGMAQRGGAVTTVVRVGEDVKSMVSDAGCADVVVAFETTEALRNHHVDRLKNKKCSARNGMLYLDMLNNLERIADHADNLASSVEPDHHDNRLLW